MVRPSLGVLPTFLLSASLAWGQGVSPFPPVPQVNDVPAVKADVPTPPPVTPPPPVTSPPPVTPPPAAPPEGSLSRWATPLENPLGNCGPTLYGRPLEKTSAITLEAEYLLWFAATSTGSTPIAQTGNNGQILFQSGRGIRSSEGPTSGGRFTLGYWDIDENPWTSTGVRTLGIETVFMFLSERSEEGVNQTTPIITRPFFDLNNRTPSGFLVAFPGLATGGVTAHTEGNLWGAEVNVWKNIAYDYPGTRWSVNVMGGFRFLDLNESLRIASVSVYEQNLAGFPAAFAPFAGNTIRTFDEFAATNRFYGGQIGIQSRYFPADCLFIDLTAKLALGATSETIDINGAQLRRFANGAETVSPAGVLALASNSGSHHRVKFAQVPELDVKFGAPITKSFTFSFGFSTMYWSRILRPGTQIDRNIDVTQIPNFPLAPGTVPTSLGQPSVPFRQSDLWLLGATVGAEFRW